jgi:hypothetical protein
LKSDGFKDDLGSLLGQAGTKVITQGTRTGAEDKTTPVEMAKDHMSKRYQGIGAKTTT